MVVCIRVGGSKSAAANGRWAKLLQQVLIATGRTSISLQSTSAICMLLMLPMRFVVIAAGLPGCLVTMTMTTTTTTIARAIDQPAHNSGTGVPKCTQSTRLICHRRLSSGHVLHLPTKHRHHHQRSAHYAYTGGVGVVHDLWQAPIVDCTEFRSKSHVCAGTI